MAGHGVEQIDRLKDLAPLPQGVKAFTHGLRSVR